MNFVFANNATSLLRYDVAASDGFITILYGEGSKFPQPISGEQFAVTLEDRRTGQIEICYCVGVTGDMLTVQRGQEGTTAKDFLNGATVSCRLTAGTIDWLVSLGGGGGGGGGGIEEAPNDGKYYTRRNFAWVDGDLQYATDTALATVADAAVQVAGDTMTGNLTINKVTPTLILQKTAAAQSNLIAGSNGATLRWSMELGNSNAEGGLNTGSNFALNRYSDAGTFVRTELAVNRATGEVTVAADPTSVLGVATKQYVDTANTTQNTNVTTALAAKQDTSQKGAINGYAGLDGSGKVPAAQLPSYVDDVIEYPNLASFPAVGEAGIIYVALDTDLTYRWSGSMYIQVGGTGGSGISDAPADGKYYTRRNSVWVDGDANFATDADLTGRVAKVGDQMTGALQLPDGTAGAPSLRFSGSTTGVRGAAAVVAVSVNAADRFVVSATDATASVKLNTLGSSSAGAGLNAPHGGAPSAPVNGDIWTTTTGLFARINGSTIGPYSAIGDVPASDGKYYVRRNQTWVDMAATPALGGFWTDIDTPDPTIFRFRDRMFIGNAVLHHDNRAGVNSTWLPDSTTGANWMPRDSQLSVMCERGVTAVFGGSRASDINDQVSGAPIGVAGAIINNTNVLGRAAWGLYSDVQHEPNGVSGSSYGLEVAAKNKGGDFSDAPYTLTYGVKGLWLAGGGDEAYGGVNTNNPNAAMVILKNTRPWNRGIVFEADGIAGTDGVTGAGIAMSLARGQMIRWYMATGPNNPGASIRSDVDISGQASTLLFGNNAVQFLNNGNARSMQITHAATGVNFINLTGTVTGAGPKVEAAGTDTNIDLNLGGKGTGVVNATSRMVTLASAAGAAGFNAPHGAAPSTPVNGDIWTTTAGIFARINGGTVGPLGAGGGGAPTTVDYLVRTADPGLSAERVVTDSTSITFDWGTAGQVAAVRAALTGDVTANAGANATTIANDAVTYAKMQNVVNNNRVLGRVSGANGDVEELTTAQATTLIDTFTSSLKGAVPGSGGGTANYLRADGTWAPPSGTGAPTNVDYLVRTADPTLSAERVVTDSTSITFDWGTAGQVAAVRAALTGDVTANAGANATTIAANVVSDAKLRQGAALTVIGRSANSTGNVADIAATAASGAVLRESGSTIGFGTIATAGHADNSITYAKMQDVTATNRLLGRITTGAGDPEELNGTQATTLLDTFTSALKGLAPSSGGGTVNFLRADGQWQPPPGVIANDSITNALLRNSVALSVIGNSTNATADPADITAGADGDVLRRSGTALGFGTIATAGIANDAVTYAKIQNVSAVDKILGRVTAGAGDIEEITCTATARSLLDDTSTSAMLTTLGAQPASGVLSGLAGLDSNLGVIEQTNAGATTFTKRKITISSSAPSGGNDGDIWFVV